MSQAFSQKELAEERWALKALVAGDALLPRFSDVFLFEDLPASDHRADDVYLDEVDRCGVYVGLFGDTYGVEGQDGLSPTEREFDRATLTARHGLVFVKGTSDANRQPKMLTLIRKVGDQRIHGRFIDVPALTAGLCASLVAFQARTRGARGYAASENPPRDALVRGQGPSL